MVTNVDIAVLTKLNELTERYGLKPYDYIASYKEEGDDHVLFFEAPAHGNALREERFDNMLLALGIGPDESGYIKAKEDKIVDLLDNALEHAPRSRRF